MENELFEKITKVINNECKALVGILCKRVEVLEKENSLTPNLYKSLIKEHIYEFSRQLNKLLGLYIQIGKVEFKSRQKE
jgi:hypothetical protein